MANKIEIQVEVDPNGTGAAAIKKITADVETLGRKSGEAGSVGRGALDGFAGGLGIPTSIAAASAALAVGILAVTKASIEASNANQNALRVLKSDAQEAGLSFETAKAEAKKFGDDLALSNTEAELSFAKLLRVLKASGEIDNTSKYRKNIENLIAAYGIAGNEIETLFNQILSGQDEALNRLGLADPSKIYKNYADSIGKAVDGLTQEEKVRSILNALSEKGERFQGAAEERLASQVGMWEELKKATADSTTALGDYLSKLTLVQYLTRNTTSVLKNGYFTAAFMQQDLEEDRLQQEKNRKYLENFKKYYSEYTKVLDDNSPEKVAAQRTAEANPFGSFQNRETLLGGEAAKKERDAFVEQYKDLFKDKRLDKSTVDFAERQFNHIKGIFDPKKAAEIEGEFTKFWDKFAKVSLSSLKAAREGAEKNFSGLAEHYSGNNNPFTKVLTQADENARTLQKTFGVLGEETVKQLQKIEQSFTRQKLLALELDAQLKANSLRREANNLQNPLSGSLSGNQERLLNQLNARINQAVNAPGLLAIADALGRGAVGSRQIDASELLQRRYAASKGLNFDQLTDEQKFLATKGRGAEIDRLNKKAYFADSGLNISQDDTSRRAIENLRNLQNFGFKEGATFGEKAKDALNSALINLFNGLSPELQASIARGGEGSSVKQSFVDAFKGGAEALQRGIEEEIKKQAVADRAVAAVREDISTIDRLRKQGLGTSEADSRLLATTGALDPKELTADIRQARIEALRREADRQVALQTEAINATKEARTATDKLTSSIDKLAGEIRKPENRKLLIEINNRAKANVRDELYGSLNPD